MELGPGSGFLNDTELSFTWRLAWNALPLADWAFKAGVVDMTDCLHSGSDQEITAFHAFYCERLHPFWSHVEEWTVRIDPKQLVLLDVGCLIDNVDPPYRSEEPGMFLAILAVARMVIWTTRKYGGSNFSHRDLILFFRHQLRIKIRCDRKRLDRITFDKGWLCADWSYERGQRWCHPSLLFLRMATMVRVLQDPTPGKLFFFFYLFCPLVSF